MLNSPFLNDKNKQLISNRYMTNIGDLNMGEEPNKPETLPPTGGPKKRGRPRTRQESDSQLQPEQRKKAGRPPGRKKRDNKQQLAE
jgi:hypothetical protein